MRSMSRGLMKSLSLVLIMLVSVLSPLSYNSATEFLQETTTEAALKKILQLLLMFLFGGLATNGNMLEHLTLHNWLSIRE